MIVEITSRAELCSAYVIHIGHVREENLVYTRKITEKHASEYPDTRRASKQVFLGAGTAKAMVVRTSAYPVVRANEH